MTATLRARYAALADRIDRRLDGLHRLYERTGHAGLGRRIASLERAWWICWHKGD